MYPKLFGIEFLNMYGLCIGIGIIACLAFLNYACKKLGIDSKFENFVEWNALIAIVLGFCSASLFQSFYNFLENPKGGFHLTSNFTFIGGLIGGVASFLIIYFAYGKKKYGAHLLDLLPIAACCILVAHAFGRIGCFCAGCCYGKEVPPHTLFAMKMPRIDENYASSADWPWLYPTQLFESAFLFIMFGICAFITVNKKYKYTMPIYLISYGVFRFLIEFIRDDDRGSLIPGLTPSQFFSIIMVLGGIALFIILPKLYKKREEKLQLAAAEGTLEENEDAAIEVENVETENVDKQEEVESVDNTTKENEEKDK